MDPAYGEIGPNTCVGMTGRWSSYSWPPAIILISVMSMFLLDFTAERYVAKKYGISGESHLDHSVHLHPAQHGNRGTGLAGPTATDGKAAGQNTSSSPNTAQAEMTERLEDDFDANYLKGGVERSFRQQIAAFLILEFGVIFHSVIIGLNLGTAGSEFTTLYPVLVFHQSFEGLGIGARMSAIPFPQRWAWLQWFLCTTYGLTTPIAIAIGLGLRTTYDSGSYTANIVSGVFDSLAAGILIYTGLVELLARDFIFNLDQTLSGRKLAFMVVCTILGTGVMALLGKWA